ncbi:MarR family transcriptional regulator [Methanothrix sp.]|uniref:MarR family transcriptional regulator n=1 Tax=Methanothrix sp. TaxID=90426 RepID=UPI003BB7912C
MIEFTEIHIKILLVLSDMEGYSNKQLTKLLGMQKTNLSRALGELEEHGVILRGEPRKSMEGKRYTETPYCINIMHPEESRRELKFFEFIIKKTVEMNKGSFCLKLLKSKYVNKLIEKYRFVSLFNILKKYNDNDVFNRIFSQSILQPACIHN